MADGSRTMTAELEADAAAAEAAREAKADVLERAGVERSPPAAKASKRAKSSVKTQWAEFTVDVWITNFNSVEFGIYKRSRNRAKSRQFSSDMDIFAEVTEGGQRTGLLGYREELWKSNTGMDKRLVFKLFSDSLNWKATMDLMIGRSLQLTLGAHGVPVSAYSLNVSDHEHMVYLERSAHKWPGMPESFSFFLLEDGRPKFYRLRQDFIDLGGDYTLYDERDTKVGTIDGKVFTIGGKWRGKVLRQHADPKLLMVLKLFCGMLLFNRQCRRHMKSLARDVHSGKLLPKLEKQEADSQRPRNLQGAHVGDAVHDPTVHCIALTRIPARAR